MKKGSEVIKLTIMGILYVACSIRYFPGRPLLTAGETLRHLLSTVPFVIGLALLGLPVLRRISATGVSALLALRVFLAIGIIVEFLYGLHNYLGRPAA